MKINIKKSFIIGLTGIIGSGKSTVLDCFKNLGAQTLSADQICRDGYKKNNELYNSLFAAFQNDILDDKKEIDRTKIRKLVRDKTKLDTLNTITHKFIIKKIISKIELFKLQNKIAVIEIPLLFEKGLEEKSDYSIVVTCDKKIIQKRIKSRDWSTSTFEFFLKEQFSQDKKVSKADYIIDNNADKISLRDKVLYFWEHILKQKIS
ncbi:dephospho-CoA kinase [bacterium]